MKVLKELAKNRKKGQSIAEILIWAVIAAFVLALVGIGAYYFMFWRPAQSYINDFKMIQLGLDSYYQSAYAYPAASGDNGFGWNDNSNYAYVPKKVEDRGWLYACDAASRQITLETPEISSDKVRSLVYQEFNHQCNEAGYDGNRVYCVLYDRPCEQ
jgi:hypothetical protein